MQWSPYRCKLLDRGGWEVSNRAMIDMEVEVQYLLPFTTNRIVTSRSLILSFYTR